MGSFLDIVSDVNVDFRMVKITDEYMKYWDVYLLHIFTNSGNVSVFASLLQNKLNLNFKRYILRVVYECIFVITLFWWRYMYIMHEK